MKNMTNVENDRQAEISAQMQISNTEIEILILRAHGNYVAATSLEPDLDPTITASPLLYACTRLNA